VVIVVIVYGGRLSWLAAAFPDGRPWTAYNAAASNATSMDQHQ